VIQILIDTRKVGMTEKQWGRRGKDYEKGIHITTVMIPRCPVPVPLIIPHAVQSWFLIHYFPSS
jgi:hypothetical protein